VFAGCADIRESVLRARGRAGNAARSCGIEIVVKDAQDLIPWKVTDVSIRPYDGYWSMNPSLHYDGQLWRCVLRCTDYAMPNGRTIRSSKSRPAGNQTKNAMVVFDPVSWQATQIYKMHERDDYPRVPCANIGYEDMRIFRTDRGGLQGIAASLHLKREKRPADGGAHNQPPEQALLSFDENYDIVEAQPIRGDWWSGTPQKNWVPFDGCAEPRFLYSIDKGTMFDDRGAVHGAAAAARPSATSLSLSRTVVPSVEALEQQRQAQEKQEREARGKQEKEAREKQEREAREKQEREEKEQREREEERRQKKERERASARQDPRTRMSVRGGDVSMVRGVRGRRVAHDAITSRPSYAVARPASVSSTPSVSNAPMRSTRVQSESVRALGTGRALPPKYEGLRGGTQLVRVADDAWLGIGHQMQFVRGLKYYWHTWYLVDSRGRMKAVSQPMKLASNGIEFAAGMGIDGDRVAVSFGVDDMECKIGETTLSAVMEVLQAVDR
jgi:hypothetical protein